VIYRRARSGGPPVSVLALGSYLTYGDRLDLLQSSRCIHAAIDCGINFFDTADGYADGGAERMLGRVLADVPRDRWLIGTKCFFPWPDSTSSGGLSRKHVVESVERSLENLRVDTIDVFQCHRFDPQTALVETVETMDLLVRQGKILHWGMGRFSAEQIDATLNCAAENGWTAPLTHQTIYGLLQREVEQDVLSAAHDRGVGTLVYGALGQGVLTGKYLDGARPPQSRAADRVQRATMYNLDTDAVAASGALAGLAHEYGASAAQLAIAWCLRREELLSVIVGATDPVQIAENAAAAELRLDDRAFDAIEGIFNEQDRSDA